MKERCLHVSSVCDDNHRVSPYGDVTSGKSLVSEWRHMPSRLNFVDEVSRGVSARSFVKSLGLAYWPLILLKSVNQRPQQLKNN